MEEGPIFPDHDMELTFDTEIRLDDVKNINNMRSLISSMLDSDEQHRLTRSLEDARRMQSNIRSRLFKLLGIKRKSLHLTEEEKRLGGRLVKERIYDFNR